MIRKCPDVVHLQKRGYFFHFFSTQAIDNTAFPLVLTDEFYQFLVHIYLGSDFIIQVFPVEGCFEDLCVHHVQVFLDVPLYLGCSRGCEGNNRCFAYFVDQWPDSPVFRPEIVTPFGNAMGFIYGIKGNLQLFEQ